jgi:RNA polymerase sigma-32 factor
MYEYTVDYLIKAFCMTSSIFSHNLSQARAQALPEAEQIACIDTYQKTGCQKSLERVLLQYSNMCMKIARRYRARFDVEDTYQNCMVFLIDAVSKYQSAKHADFFRFAYLSVSSAMSLQGIIDWSSMTGPKTKGYLKAFRHVKSLPSSSGTLSTRDARVLAERIGVREDEVMAAYSLYHHGNLSMDAPITDTGLSLLDGLVSDCDVEQEVIDARHQGKMISRIRASLYRLTAKEKDVFHLRVLTDQPLTSREVGELIGVSTQRAAQLEQKAINKLKVAA